jgi:hypothetical protein
MKSILVTSSLIASIAFLLAIGSTPLVFASTNTPFATATSSSHSLSFSPVLTSVPVTVKFSPKSYTTAPGSTVTTDLTVKDTGTKSYTFTGCKTTEDGTKLSCSLTSSFTIKGGQTLTGTLAIEFSTTAAAGKYTFKFSYMNSVDVSSTGTFTITVT